MDDQDKYVEEKFDEIMPWIGFYITAASAVCTVAMAADAFNGFRRKMYWFPCKYFTLNGLSLTLLAIVMKLTQDVNTNLYRNRGILPAKESSFAIMSTCMANFMPSLGSMNDKELVANMVALGIMVITILANVLIDTIQLNKIRYITFGGLIYSSSLLLLLLALIASAISIPTIKRDLESKYQEKHKVALMADELKVQRRDALIIDRWRREMMKYWVMAETSCPQFVLARSAVCTTSSLIPLVSVIIYLVSLVWSMATDVRELLTLKSVYGEFTRWILLIQTIGVIVGMIAPTSRWFVAVGFKCSTTHHYNLRKEFRIESHWIQALVDRRGTFSSVQIRQHKWKRYLHDAKWFFLTFCIGIQILIIIFNKLLVLIPALVVRSIFLCTARTTKLVMWLVSKIRTSNNHTENDDSNDNLKSYVLLLDGEPELPAWILKGICRRADNTIRMGKKKQSMSLLNLLRRFDNFNGVAQFDTIQQISAQDIPNCWTLPVVTLASIAIALPNISKHEREQLLSSVNQGLSFAKIVDKASDNNAQLLNIRKAADVSWVGVALYSKWFDVDLSKISLKCKNSDEVLQELYKKAERTILEYKRENYGHWPVKVVASNSMHRICQTILSSFDVESEQTDEGVFERLSIMIADILAACLTNLAHIITTMCHHNAIEKREERVHEAFLLLGKTEHILELLQKHKWPYMDHDKAAYIDEWRASLA